VGILQNYTEQGIPDNNRFKFEPGDKPPIVKSIPSTIDSNAPKANEVTKRADDLVRIGKILTQKEGVKYLANEALLNAGKYKPNPKRKTGVGKKLSVLSQGLLDTAKLIGSTLAQVPVNGTGLHFVKRFAGKGEGTYLNDIGFDQTVPHAVNNPLQGASGKSLPDARGVSSKADEALQDNGLSIVASAPSGTNTDSVSKTGEVGITFKPGLGYNDKFTDETQSGNKNITVRVGLGSPGKDQTLELGEDKINLLAPVDAKLDGKSGDTGRDLIKFRIQVLTPGEDDANPNAKHLYFRAFLNTFSDSVSSNWNSFQYTGRGESFHTYGGFERSIDVGFHLAAQSRAEMRPMYRKLNYLIGSTAPTYKNNFMRGTFVKLTVGDYIYEIPGFINNVTITWNNDYPWEIAAGRIEEDELDTGTQELPMILDVNFGFTPIHSFIPTAGGFDSSLGQSFASKYITNGFTDENTYIEQNDFLDGNFGAV
jgi:hypothetical protein